MLVGAPALARAQEGARSIHDATRNTLTGAIGARLRRLVGGSPGRAHGHEGRERVPLPAPGRRPALPLAEALARYEPAPGFAPASLRRAELARLLHFTNGVTGEDRAGAPLRAAPSAGALYAGEVYLVAEDVEGLEPGVYAFLPLEARLARLGAGRRLADVAAALEEPARAEGAGCAVLLTNVFARYEHRYANRGYRYALLDTGHLGENLRLTATSAGLAEWGPLRFRDAALNALVGVDGVEEAVCAVHLVGARGGAPERGAVVPLAEAARAGHPVPEAADDAPERYHAATMLVPDGAATGVPWERSAVSPTIEPEGRETDALLALPEPRRAARTVETSIEIRRSARRFLPEPIAAAELAFALRAAAGHPHLARAAGVELRLFVHRVADLAPGLYRVLPRARRLDPLRTGAWGDALVEACLGQDKAGEAAVALAMVGDLSRAASAGGDRTWRDLCIECGGIGQRIYLAAEALGLAARNLAAYVDEELNELAGVDGRERAVLHLTLLGAGD